MKVDLDGNLITEKPSIIQISKDSYLELDRDHNSVEYTHYNESLYEVMSVVFDSDQSMRDLRKALDVAIRLEWLRKLEVVGWYE